MQIGFLGLGKMGRRIVAKLLDGGYKVVVWNRSEETVAQFLKERDRDVLEGNLSHVSAIADFSKQLPGQKIFWVMLPAGEATESVITQLDSIVQKGDIVIDGGNSFYQDTQRLYEHFTKKGIGFLGIGVSGGILAPKNGFPLMVGGDKGSYDAVVPLFETLSKPHGGYDYFGPGGAGHFVKMVHNGIEYGMMQAIGEGFGVLEKSPYQLDLEKVASLWTNNTIVASFLIERARDALDKDAHLERIDGQIDATGEAAWTVDTAKEEGVSVPVIEKSLEYRQQSKTDTKVSSSFAARMVAALRHEFGGHTVKGK